MSLAWRQAWLTQTDKPLRLSWSRIRTHTECRAKGRLMREHKPPNMDIRGFFHGTVVDRAMRKWLDQEKPEPGWMLAHVDKILDEEEQVAKDTGDGIVRWKSAGDKQQLREFCRELVVRLEVVLQEYCLPFSWDPAIRFEVPLVINDLQGLPRKIHMIGEIDLLVKRPEGLVVYDLKATRDNGYWRKVTGQLLFYDIAMWGQTREWPITSGLIQPMCDNQLPHFQFSMEDRTQMFAVIERTARDIWRDDLLPKEDCKGCADCDVRHACPKFATSMRRGRAQLLPVLQV
jgi:PD-(D/E)XK nuclease superfamily